MSTLIKDEIALLRNEPFLLKKKGGCFLCLNAWFGEQQLVRRDIYLQVLLIFCIFYRDFPLIHPLVCHYYISLFAAL